MGLLEEIRKAQPAPCRLSTIATNLDAADQAELWQAIADPALSAAVIARVLRARGHSISDDVVLRHRRSECATCGDGS